MNPLESRKQLLVAESDLNRVQMQEEWQAMTVGIHGFAARAKSFGAMASSAAVLVTGLAAFRRVKSVDAEAKPSWLQTVLKGAGLISTLWLAFRPPGSDHKNK
jgi:hypothetical protein